MVIWHWKKAKSCLQSSLCVIARVRLSLPKSLRSERQPCLHLSFDREPAVQPFVSLRIYAENGFKKWHKTRKEVLYKPPPETEVIWLDICYCQLSKLMWDKAIWRILSLGRELPTSFMKLFTRNALVNWLSPIFFNIWCIACLVIFFNQPRRLQAQNSKEKC